MTRRSDVSKVVYLRGVSSFDLLDRPPLGGSTGSMRSSVHRRWWWELSCAVGVQLRRLLSVCLGPTAAAGW